MRIADWIIYESDDLLAVRKPPGLPTQPDKTGDEDLHTMAKKYSQEEVLLLHRLDRPVGGIVLFAKNPKWAGLIFEKKYLAVCCGEAPKDGKLQDYLLKNQRLNTSKAVNKNVSGAKAAALSFRRLGAYPHNEWGTLSLVEIDLLTGRHHQIRVQLANAGLPLYGDTKYNPAFSKARGQFSIGLIAYRVLISLPGGESLELDSPPGDVFPFNLFN